MCELQIYKDVHVCWRGAHYHTYCTIVTFATAGQDEVKGSSSVCDRLWSKLRSTTAIIEL